MTAVCSDGHRASISSAASAACAIVRSGVCACPIPSSSGASTSLQKHVSASGSTASALGTSCGGIGEHLSTTSQPRACASRAACCVGAVGSSSCSTTVFTLGVMRCRKLASSCSPTNSCAPWQKTVTLSDMPSARPRATSWMAIDDGLRLSSTRPDRSSSRVALIRSSSPCEIESEPIRPTRLVGTPSRATETALLAPLPPPELANTPTVVMPASAWKGSRTSAFMSRLHAPKTRQCEISSILCSDVSDRLRRSIVRCACRWRKAAWIESAASM